LIESPAFYNAGRKISRKGFPVNFLQTLRERIIVGDGAFGTMLYSRGVGLDVNFEHLNLVRPSLVTELHREYVAAGAEVLETNTFGANAVRLGAIGLERKVREINLQGARLARDAAGDQVFVAGSMGPLGSQKGTEREISTEEEERVFREQAEALAEGGIDLFILETFSETREMKAALAAVKPLGLPVIASMAYLEGGRTRDGLDAERATRELETAGADIIGVNCGAGPLEILRNVQRIAATTSLPISAFPNSGFPEYVDGRYIYRTTPEYFASMAAEMAAAGAALIGGCCGTTPEHVRRLSEALGGRRPVIRKIALRGPEKTERQPSGAPETGVFGGWGKEKVVTVELEAPRGLDTRKLMEGCRRVKEAGADAVNLAENPLAKVRAGNIALAHLIRREVGIDVIPHITCRDRNLLGLQSDLMGASLLGVRYILAVTGDPARLGDHGGASSVYDLNSFGLIRLLSDLNSGVNALGNPIGEGTEFTIGCAFNPNTPKMETQVARLEKKVANGAKFVQTQPLYDTERLETMLELTRPLGIPVLPGILPLVSERNCEFLHNEVPGIVIPDEIRERMKGKEKESGVREGLAIAREFIDAALDLCGGFYIIPPFGKYEIAAELIRHIRSQSAGRGK
jgi:methionine synthase / methylenetetrahydrofolate reductase(NADPH)